MTNKFDEDLVGALVEAVKAAPVPVDKTINPNDRFKIMDFTIGTLHRRVYLLNPGDNFARFGGSSAGLTVRKTASLIVSDVQHGSRSDAEYDLTDEQAWVNILHSYRLSWGKKAKRK